MSFIELRLEVRKINPLFCFSRQGSDRRWIESLDDQPDRHDHFLWRHHHFQIKPIAAGIHVKEFQQGGSHIENHGDQAPDGQPAGNQPGAVEGEV